MEEVGNLVLMLYPKEERNKGAIVEAYSDIVTHCRDKYRDEASCINNAISKSQDLIELFDKKFPFFDKSIKTTNICYTFAVLYDTLNRICDVLTRDVKFKTLEKPNRMVVKDVKELRNVVDQKWTSPKGHIEEAILAPLEYLKNALVLGDTINFSYEDCLNILVLIQIVCADVVSILNDDSNSTFLLGRDYCIKAEEIIVLNGVAKTVVEAADEMAKEIEELDNDDGVTEVLTSEPKPKSKSKKKEVKVMSETKVEENLYDLIVSGLDDVTKDVTTYKEVQDKIEISIPDVNLPPEVVDKIKDSIKSDISTYLTPIGDKINSKCEVILSEIDELQRALYNQVEYINSLKSSLALA